MIVILKSERDNTCILSEDSDHIWSHFSDINGLCDWQTEIDDESDQFMFI